MAEDVLLTEAGSAALQKAREAECDELLRRAVLTCINVVHDEEWVMQRLATFLMTKRLQRNPAGTDIYQHPLGGKVVVGGHELVRQPALQPLDA